MRRAYFAGLLALMTGIAGGELCNAIFFISQPYQINYGEGLAAWQAARVTDLARAYAPIDQYPYVVFQYPPLFHLATRAIGTMAANLLQGGRIVSVLSAALLCFVIGWITFQALPRRLGLPGRLFAAAFAAALPTTLYNFHWTWLARVDTLAVLLSCSGVALFAARPGSKTMQLLAPVLMTAALFTRQSALAAPLACLLVALLMDRKIALRMAAVMGMLGGVVLGWLAWRTHGQILLHLLRYNQTGFSLTRAALGLLMNTRHVAGLLLLAGGASYGPLRLRWASLASSLRANGYRRSVLLLTAYCAFAALSSLAFGKEGSDINYFLEWNVSLAPLAGILLFRAIGAGDLRRWRSARMAALAVPLLLLSTGLDQARDGWLRIFREPLAVDSEQLDAYRQMIAVIRDTPGLVFSEDMNLLYETGREIPAEPAMIQVLAKAGMWDESPFVRMIRERRFALIVTMVNRESSDVFSRQRYSPAVAGAIAESYEQSSRIDDYLIYRPSLPPRP